MLNTERMTKPLGVLIMDTVSTIMARAMALAEKQHGKVVSRPTHHTYMLTCECCGDDVGKLYSISSFSVCYECADVIQAHDVEF